MKHLIPFMLLLFFCSLPRANGQEKNNISPVDELPSHISRLTDFGQRAEFSQDGQRILFIEKTFGDFYEVELKTMTIFPLTHQYFHEGYTRALYLSNDDILLSGARNKNN